MIEDIENAVTVVEEHIRQEYEKAWRRVADEDIPNYRILIWGSVIQENKDPTDLDLIFEYEGTNISPDKENSIESIIKNSVYMKEYSYVDPLVTHYLEVPDIVSRSRVSRVYSVDESGFIEFD